MRRVVQSTHYLLSERFPEPEKLPLRKQVCLMYIRWGATHNREDRTKLVELAKAWRKEPGRVAGHRTLMERKIRKLFRRDKKHRGLEASREGAKKWGEESHKKGIGVHSPENKAKLAEHNRRIRREQTENGTVRASDWIIFPKDGEPFKIRNLAKWARENGVSSWVGTTAGNPNKWFRGYRCEKYNEEWDNL